MKFKRHLRQRLIFTNTSQSGSTTNRIGAERYQRHPKICLETSKSPFAKTTFSPCAKRRRDSNGSQAEEKMADRGCFFQKAGGHVLG